MVGWSDRLDLDSVYVHLLHLDYAIKYFRCTLLYLEYLLQFLASLKSAKIIHPPTSRSICLVFWLIESLSVLRPTYPTIRHLSAAQPTRIHFTCHILLVTFSLSPKPLLNFPAWVPSSLTAKLHFLLVWSKGTRSTKFQTDGLTRQCVDFDSCILPPLIQKLTTNFCPKRKT